MLSTSNLLIEYSKRENVDFSPEAVRQFLIPYYNYHMTYMDVLRILLDSILDINSGEQWIIAPEERIWRELILRLVTHKLGDKEITSVDDVVAKLIKDIMYVFRFSLKGKHVSI